MCEWAYKINHVSTNYSGLLFLVVKVASHFCQHYRYDPALVVILLGMLINMQLLQYLL